MSDARIHCDNCGFPLIDCDCLTPSGHYPFSCFGFDNIPEQMDTMEISSRYWDLYDVEE